MNPHDRLQQEGEQKKETVNLKRVIKGLLRKNRKLTERILGIRRTER